MIAFLVVCLLPAVLLVVAVPVVLFGLMLETARERAGIARQEPAALEPAPMSPRMLQPGCA